MSPHKYQPTADFAREAGRQPNVVGYFSGWAQPFVASFARWAPSHGAVLIVQIDPTYASVQAIANGAYDNYLQSHANSVREIGHPVIIGFGHEMNAPWYSWGYGHVPAATFVAACRHIVTIFRSQGANNVTWLWTINAALPNTAPISSWWPGAAYVTWIGIDAYYYRPTDDFTSASGRPSARCGHSPKSGATSETAVGPEAGQPPRSGICSPGCASTRL